MKINRLILCLLFVFNIQNLYASTQAKDLRDQIASFITQYGNELAAKGYRFDYEIGSIDPRLSVGQCEHNLSFEFVRPPIQQSHNTVKVSCLDNTPWKLYVSTSINIWGPTVQTSRAVARGATITAADLTISEAVLNRSHQALFNDMSSVIGMVAKRSLRAGQTLAPHNLTPPNLITRGDQVIISAKNSNISIKMNGTALSHGVLGQEIRVKNNKSERIIKAKVVDHGKVAITM